MQAFEKIQNGDADYICRVNLQMIPTRLPKDVIDKYQKTLYNAAADTNRGLLHEIISSSNNKIQACRGYGYPWIYPWIYPCVDMILRPRCGYIHGYYAGTDPN